MDFYLSNVIQLSPRFKSTIKTHAKINTILRYISHRFVIFKVEKKKSNSKDSIEHFYFFRLGFDYPLPQMITSWLVVGKESTTMENYN